MERLKRIIPAALFAMLVGAGVAAWLHPGVKLPVITEQTGGKAPSVDALPGLYKVDLSIKGEGNTRWRLFANRVKLNKDKRIILDKVKLTFYPEKGGRYDLTGKTGIYYQDRREVEVIGDVFIKSHDGMTLKTERLLYDEKKQLVTTDLPVTAKGRLFKIDSVGMVVDIERSTVVFLKQVDSIFVPKGKGPPPGATMD